MAEAICDKMGRLCSWSYPIGFSDHKAIFIQLEFDTHLIFYPFKFNLVWLGDSEFDKFIVDTWKHLSNPLTDMGSRMIRLVNKLKLLEGVVKKWEGQKKLDN